VAAHKLWLRSCDPEVTSLARNFERLSEIDVMLLANLRHSSFGDRLKCRQTAQFVRWSTLVYQISNR